MPGRRLSKMVPGKNICLTKNKVTIGPTRRRRRSSRNKTCTVQTRLAMKQRKQQQDIGLIQETLCTGHSFFRSNHSTMHRLWNLQRHSSRTSDWPTSYSSMQMVHSCSPPSCPTQSFSVALNTTRRTGTGEDAAGLPLCGDERPCRP